VPDDQRTVEEIAADLKKQVQKKKAAHLTGETHYANYEESLQQESDAEKEIDRLNTELLQLVCPEAIPDPPPEPVDPALTAEPPRSTLVGEEAEAAAAEAERDA
jgi:hypothetical protein